MSGFDLTIYTNKYFNVFFIFLKHVDLYTVDLFLWNVFLIICLLPLYKRSFAACHINTTNSVIWFVLNKFSITEHKFYAKLKDVLKVIEEYQKDSMHSVPMYKTLYWPLYLTI